MSISQGCFKICTLFKGIRQKALVFQVYMAKYFKFQVGPCKQ